MNKILIILISFLLLSGNDDLEYAIRYGQAAIYQRELNKLQNEINDLKTVLRLHNKVLEYLLKENSCDDLMIFFVKKPLKVYKDKNLTKYIYTLPKNYYFEGTLKGKKIKMKFFFNKNGKWKVIKHKRYLLFEKSKIKIKNPF